LHHNNGERAFIPQILTDPVPVGLAFCARDNVILRAPALYPARQQNVLQTSAKASRQYEMPQHFLDTLM
jgi:hypothetical protein